MPLPHTVKEIKLKNGAAGLLVDVPHTSVFTYEFNFRAGYEYARDPSVQQVAHLLEHMMYKATQRCPSVEDFSREFTKNGAYSNASTAEVNMFYYADAAEMEWERILKLQIEALESPVLTAESLATEKENVRSELNGQAANDTRVLWQAMGKAVGDTSLTDKEKVATIDKVTIDDIREHYTRTHTTDNLRFVVAGPLTGNEDKLRDLIENIKLPHGERFAVHQTKLYAAKPIHIAREDRDDIAFGLSLEVQRRLSEEEKNTMACLDHLLSGTFHSRVYGVVRERGLSYDLGFDYGSGIDGTSCWTLGGQMNHERSDELLNVCVSEMKKVVDGDIKDEELEEARQFARGSYQKSYQTVDSLGSTYGARYFADLPLRSIEKVVEDIEAVTPERIQKLAAEFVATKTWVYGEIGTMTSANTKQHARIFESLAG